MYTKDWLSRWAVYSPDKTAIEEYEPDRSISYDQLNRYACKLAHWLTQKGLTKGDRIFIIAEHSIEMVALFGAAQKTGVILVPVNYRLAKPEIAYLAENSGPALILYEEQFADKLPQNISEKDIPAMLMEQVLAMSDASYPESFEAVPLSEQDPVFILYTSGTTGYPKGALYTHGMLFWNSLNTGISFSLTPDDHTVNCMPGFHTGGWNVLLTPMLHHGATVGLVKKFDASKMLRLLENRGSTIFMGVPTMLKMMEQDPAYNTVKLERMKYLIVGGEAMPHPLIQAWHRKGVSIRQGFGLTEVGPNLTSLQHRDAERKLGSIGKPNFYVALELFDDDFNPVPPGEIGECCLKGEAVTTGYWQNEEATRKSFRDGWFKTGDLMRRDEEGYLYVVDRKKAMFISGGENVYPAEVERALLKARGVSEAAIVGVPDERWGEVGKAFLVVEEGTSLDAVREHCIAQLAKFKVPKYFNCLAELPKNGSGKIDRKKLKEL